MIERIEENNYRMEEQEQKPNIEEKGEFSSTRLAVACAALFVIFLFLPFCFSCIGKPM